MNTGGDGLLGGPSGASADSDRSIQSDDSIMRVAVIGAGVSGLSAARVLHDHGYQVRVFEKSRGLGGRAATRPRGVSTGSASITAPNTSPYAIQVSGRPLRRGARVVW